MKRLFILVVLLLMTTSLIFAQTTGKIAGLVYDADSNEPLIGANVYLEGTSMGAATGLDGSFFIINVPSGKYNVIVETIGYEKQIIRDFRVSVNRTSSLELKLKQAIIEGQVVEILAERFATKKDQTSSMRTVSSDQIESLPVENVNQIISMQAGVVNGHFRGGRSNEVSYLIDGLPVTDAYGGEGRNVDVETESIEDLEIITGTFNAEYGRAMSGLVNQVIKDGDVNFHASFSSSLGNYYTSHNNVFKGLKNSELNRNQDYKVQLSGPIYKDVITFFANARFQDNKNHLNGVRRFEVDDYSDFNSTDPAFWYSEHSGDSAYVPMNGSKNVSLLGKIAYKTTNAIRMSVLYTLNLDNWDGYNHAFKYNPDGVADADRTTNMIAYNLNHMISNSAFYEIKISYLDNYDGYYLYQKDSASRYIYDAFLGNNNETGFYTGGQQKDFSKSWQRDFNAKFDLTWQLSKQHALKSGFLYTYHILKNRWTPIQKDPSKTDFELDTFEYNEYGKRVYYNYKPYVYTNSSVYADLYQVKPIELSAYLQDKMEFDDMVINLGVRLDYFDPNTTYPSQPRNPSNQRKYNVLDADGHEVLGPDSLPIPNMEKMSTYPYANVKLQISPRLGLAYQLGKKAVLHFSYGHFFQMPPMNALYQDNSHLVSPDDWETTMGNPQLKAQKTVQYEIGLWQELMDGMGLEVTLYYRDIYDLLSAKVITTFWDTEYGLYSNKDYGNSRGLELKYDFVLQALKVYINYTLQYTRGNADNPTQTFTRAGDSMDPINKLIPMSWDQRHTFNATVGYYKADYGLTMTGYYNSGSPYTWSSPVQDQVSRVNLYNNNDAMPSGYSVDLTAYYNITLFKDLKATIDLSVYNLLDRQNPAWVYGNTGRPYTAIVQQADRDNHRSDFNDYEDRIKNPTGYSAPRMVKLGLGINF